MPEAESSKAVSSPQTVSGANEDDSKRRKVALPDPASAKRKLNEANSIPVPSVDDDTDMLSICQLFKESAESDISDICFEIRKMGLMSIKNDVSEIYSRPRITAYAASLGLSPGFALDLAVIDPDDGQPWDFDVPE